MKTPAKTKSRKYKKQAAANSVVEEKEVAYKTKASARRSGKKFVLPSGLHPWVKRLMLPVKVKPLSDKEAEKIYLQAIEKKYGK